MDAEAGCSALYSSYYLQILPGFVAQRRLGSNQIFIFFFDRKPAEMRLVCTGGFVPDIFERRRPPAFFLWCEKQMETFSMVLPFCRAPAPAPAADVWRNPLRLWAFHLANVPLGWVLLA